ncbi:glutathione S-transferase C-terminal-like protein [Fomitopsis schrenkii]|uniref:glutathione transferase n=1 Tax=Fomitopsis schrenkii TaxID=2126942 RepID=S8E786_FOMSC|nr:glutathione S-transferase C-terminal-like protein [Fomitopsis schrenkii]
MSHGKQFTLYTTPRGPNGWKVAFVLGELGLEYHSIYLDINKNEHNSAEHTKYNPNGRVPTLIDHSNNDFVIWESCAIMQYLVDKYDTEHRISVSDAHEKYHQLQWLFFQASGQGPYYGQASWFLVYHPEKVPSAIERYSKEIVRVLGVLESVLSKQEWLVGGKCTIADISFIPWNQNALAQLEKIRPEVNIERDFPAVLKWHNTMIAREPIAELLKLRNTFPAANRKLRV